MVCPLGSTHKAPDSKAPRLLCGEALSTWGTCTCCTAWTWSSILCQHRQNYTTVDSCWNAGRLAMGACWDPASKSPSVCWYTYRADGLDIFFELSNMNWMQSSWYMSKMKGSSTDQSDGLLVSRNHCWRPWADLALLGICAWRVFSLLHSSAWSDDQ